MSWRGRKDRQLLHFLALSFLLHLLSAMLFAVYAEQVMNNRRQEVFYIDLNQLSLPIAAPAEEKKKQAVNKPRQAPVPVKAAQQPQPAKAAAPPMQQTVFSETAKPAPVTDPGPVSAPVRDVGGAPGPQTGASARTAVSGIPTEGAAPVGDVAFGSAAGPSFMQRVLPAYPMVARRFNREGRVVLRLTIDAGGFLTAVEVLEDPGYGFAAAAVDAVKKSRFRPARHEGRPIIAKAILPVRFTLQGIN